MMANGQTTIGPDSIAIVEAIRAMASTLTERVSKTESDFISHLQKVEARLDQLVELTKSVAIIQTQAHSQAEQMTELRTQLRMIQDKTDTSISRIHVRIEETATQLNLKMDVKEKECESNIKGVAASHGKLSEEFHYYLNRGAGSLGAVQLPDCRHGLDR